MIHDLVRTACVIATMSVAAALIVETRMRLAAIELAARQAAPAAAYAHAHAHAHAHAPPPTGPLARLGQATLGWADAALGVVR